MIQTGFERHVLAGALEAGVALSSLQLKNLETYYELLRRWNRVINLTSLPLESYPPQTLDRLIVEPLFAVRCLPEGACACVDLGSGGGSPAVPLKITRPDMALRMVESRGRKAAFLRDVVRLLPLDETEVINQRIADLPGDLSGSADTVTVRAVRPDRELLESAVTLLKPGGSLLLFNSGGGAMFESEALAGLNVTSRVRLPDERTIVVLRRGV